MPTLEDAIVLAVNSHKGQVDLNGEPYVLHPLRVMMKLESVEEKMVGVLHDVLEETDFQFDNLCNIGYSQDVVKAVDVITRRESEDYFEYIQRVKANPLARAAKIADLEDNMDLSRLRKLSDKDYDRMNKYIRAWHMLKEDLPDAPA